MAMAMLEEDLSACIEDLSHYIFRGFHVFPEQIQHVLIDMRFQLGGAGLRKFKLMIAAAQEGNWREMAIQMENSAWYGQVPTRAKKLILMVNKVV